MDRPPARKNQVKVFRARLPYQPEPVVVVRTTQTQVPGDSSEFIDIPVCPCGKVLHHIQEVAAFCAVGGEDEPLCENCASNRCDICGKSICPEHRRKLGTRQCCVTHGFWEQLRLAFRPEEEQTK